MANGGDSLHTPISSRDPVTSTRCIICTWWSRRGPPAEGSRTRRVRSLGGTPEVRHDLLDHGIGRLGEVVPIGVEMMLQELQELDGGREWNQLTINVKRYHISQENTQFLPSRNVLAHFFQQGRNAKDNVSYRNLHK